TTTATSFGRTTTTTIVVVVVVIVIVITVIPLPSSPATDQDGPTRRGQQPSLCPTGPLPLPSTHHGRDRAVLRTHPAPHQAPPRPGLLLLRLRRRVHDLQVRGVVPGGEEAPPRACSRREVSGGHPVGGGGTQGPRGQV
ncbi:hypothetical protein HKX48_008823, partial [Thoreauomyces humboldtii]